jgi:hypothetical protein
MYFFGAPKLSCIHSTTLEPKWCLRVFLSISLTFGTEKDAIVVFRAWLHYFDPFYSGWPKMMFGSVLDHFSNLQDLKRWKTHVLGPNALFQGSELAKPPFYYIRPKMMFGSVSEHFASLRHIKRCNSYVSGLTALFWGIEVAMHPFFSGWPKIMFGSVLDHFANLRT